MKSLFWKKVETSNKNTYIFIYDSHGNTIEKQGKPPKLEEGLSLTYLIDKNLYIHFGNHKTFKSESTLETSFQKSSNFPL